MHHALRHWADRGETSVANSALLCWHHHTLVDTTGITMAWAVGATRTEPGYFRAGPDVGRTRASCSAVMPYGPSVASATGISVMAGAWG